MLLTAPEERAAITGVLLFHGRGWYSRVAALLGSPAATLVSVVVVSTDAGDPDLQHAERLGLRFSFGPDPGNPRVEAWRRWVASLPVSNSCEPDSPPPAAAVAPGEDAARVRNLLVSRGLTRREVEIALLAASGLGNPEIAQQLFLSLATIKGTLRRVYGKLGVTRRAGLRALLR